MWLGSVSNNTSKKLLPVSSNFANSYSPTKSNSYSQLHRKNTKTATAAAPSSTEGISEMSLDAQGWCSTGLPLRVYLFFQVEACRTLKRSFGGGNRTFRLMYPLTELSLSVLHHMNMYRQAINPAPPIQIPTITTTIRHRMPRWVHLPNTHALNPRNSSTCPSYLLNTALQWVLARGMVSRFYLQKIGSSFSVSPTFLNLLYETCSLFKTEGGAEKSAEASLLSTWSAST